MVPEGRRFRMAIRHSENHSANGTGTRKLHNGITTLILAYTKLNPTTSKRKRRLGTDRHTEFKIFCFCHLERNPVDYLLRITQPVNFSSTPYTTSSWSGKIITYGIQDKTHIKSIMTTDFSDTFNQCIFRPIPFIIEKLQLVSQRQIHVMLFWYFPLPFYPST